MKTTKNYGLSRALRRLSLVALCLPLLAGARAFDLGWFTVDGGGGTSTSTDGRFAVSGTIGQPDAGYASGGINELFGGFWYRAAACNCLLNIQVIGSNVVVTWPASFRGCTLETTTALRSPASAAAWTPVNAVLTGSTYTYVTPATDAARFFRLNGA